MGTGTTADGGARPNRERVRPHTTREEGGQTPYWDRHRRGRAEPVP